VLKARRYPANRFGDELSPIADNRDSQKIGQNRHAPGYGGVALVFVVFSAMGGTP